MGKKYYEAYDFEDLKLYGEVFDNMSFIDCTFRNCTFEDVKIINSSLIDCKFEKTSIINLKAEEYSEIQGLEFKKSRLFGINWKELTPDGAFVDPIDIIKNSSLKYNTFYNMKLKKIDLSDNEIIDSIFTECDLIEAKFKDCKLDNTEFLKSNLSKSDFRNSVGYQVDISSCKLKGAKFSFPEAMNLLNSLEIILD